MSKYESDKLLSITDAGAYFLTSFYSMDNWLINDHLSYKCERVD